MSALVTYSDETVMTKTCVPYNMAKDNNGRATRYGAHGGQAQAAAKDMTLWRNIVVVALCPTGDEENKYIILAWMVTFNQR